MCLLSKLLSDDPMNRVGRAVSLEEVRSTTKQTIGIFNNDFRGYAPENCIQLMRMLGLAEKKHETTLKRIQDHIEGKALPREQQEVTLDSFGASD